MNRIPATDIQKFIAGALTYIGLQALFLTGNLLIFAETDGWTIAITLFPSIGLLIGIAMLIGNERAIFWARSFLLIFILVGIGFAAATRLSASPIPTKELKDLIFWQSAFALFAPAIFLCLLVFSRSKRSRDDAAA